MTIYAVIKSGSKEYRVAQGDVVRVEKLAAAPGDTVEIREVSSIETAQGVTVGSPTVVDARVIAEVIEEGHGEKILIFKKKRRDHYQMMTGDLQSYTALRIREIAVGESVYAAAAPRRDVAAATTPPPPPAPSRISKPERKVVVPHAKKPPQAAMPPTPPSPAPIEILPPVAAQVDAPVSPEIPSARVIPLPRVETAAPAPAFAEREGPKRRHAITALVAGLVVIAAGLLLWSGGEPRAPGQAAVEVVTVAAPAQAAQPSAPPPAAKAPPRKELAVKKTAAAGAPSAPVQPPE
jgi:large subunit ribosomal protein L21